jgi:hypothetical protein
MFPVKPEQKACKMFRCAGILASNRASDSPAPHGQMVVQSQRASPRKPQVSTNQDQLIAVLRVTTAAVKILAEEDSGHTRKVTAALALTLARTGAYEWGGSSHRVRWMRPVIRTITDARPGMPVMPPTPEWMQRMGYEVFGA